MGSSGKKCTIHNMKRRTYLQYFAPPEGTLFAWRLVLPIALVVFALSVRIHLEKNPLRLDETDYYQSMKNVVALGLPLYYAGEVSVRPESLISLGTRNLAGGQFDFYRFRPETGVLKETFFALTEGDSRYTYALWHPPLYVYLGSLVFRAVPLTPQNSHLLRYFNLIFSIAMFAGMVALGREVYGRRGGVTAALAMLLFSLNSLAVRGSILIDYNATLGPCVAIWFAVGYLRSERRNVHHLGLILLTTLAFLTGLGIGLTLIAGALAHGILFTRLRTPWRALASVSAGFLAFFPVFLGLCQLLGLPFSQPFLHNFQRAGAQPDLTWLVALARSALEFSAFYSREVGYPAALLGFGLFVQLIASKQLLRQPERAFAPLLVLIGFVLQGSLRAEAYGFPKYILFLLPLLFVYLAGETLNLLLSGCRSRPVKVAVGLALAALILTQSAQSLADLQRGGSTLYWPGEQGIKAAARRLNSRTAADETVLTRKDVAFFADRKFVQWYGVLLTDADYLRRRVEAENIRYAANNAVTLSAVSPAVADYLNLVFTPVSQEGDFQLLGPSDIR